ncbi:hypothetical protein VTO73DRAFT_2029, partial [Trametes versicolor]
VARSHWLHRAMRHSHCAARVRLLLEPVRRRRGWLQRSVPKDRRLPRGPHLCRARVGRLRRSAGRARDPAHIYRRTADAERRALPRSRRAQPLVRRRTETREEAPLCNL